MWSRLRSSVRRGRDAAPDAALEGDLRDRAAGLAGSGVRAWLAFDEDVRRAPLPPTWSAALRDRLLAGTATAEDVLLAACHRDGHLREAAVRVSADARVAALRSGDWVPQVRDLARARCRAALPGALPVLAEFAGAVQGRARGGWVVDTVAAALADAPPAVLDAARAVGDPRARRMVFRLTADSLALPDLLRAALTDRDQDVRLTCGAAALRAARATGDPAALHPLLTASTSALRADAVHTLALAGDPRPARRALTDRAGIVRRTAQAALHRAGEDPAAHYRAVDPHTADSAAGLGETGTRADAAALIPLLAAPLPRTRAAAVDALRALDATPRDLVARLLADPSPRVCGRAVRALRERPPPEALLRGLLAPGNPPHTRRAAHSLLCATSAACRLRTNLLLAADGADPLHTAAVQDIATWLRTRSATSYLTADDAPWPDLVAAAARALGPERTRILRFNLGC